MRSFKKIYQAGQAVLELTQKMTVRDNKTKRKEGSPFDSRISVIDFENYDSKCVAFSLNRKCKNCLFLL